MVDRLFRQVGDPTHRATTPKTPLQLTCCFLQDALEQYRTWHLIEGHTAATVRASVQTVEHLARYLGAVDPGALSDLNAITPLHIMGWMRAQQEAGNKPPSVKTRYASIKAFFRWAETWDLVLDSPVRKIKTPKVPRVRKRTPKAVHLKAMLDACPPGSFHGARRRAILLLFVTTGMRKQELCDLALADVDWPGGLVRIRMGKGQKERRVPLVKDALRALLRYVQYRGDRPGPLWVKQTGEPILSSGIATEMRRLKVAAGFTDEDFEGLCHIYRRRFAEQAVEQDMGRWETVTIGGWTDPAMIDYYTRGLAEEERAAAQFRRFDPLR